jgi:YD repeat-containing protein
MYCLSPLPKTALLKRIASSLATVCWRLVVFCAALFCAGPLEAVAQVTPQIPPTQNPDLLPASFLPKSPTLAPFLRFDEQRNVDLMTGAAQMSVPLVELSSGTLHLPISLGYSYSGLKVFQTQDLVGLGWSLQAGGSISRQINGLPDEQGSAYGPYSSAMVLQGLTNDEQQFYKDAFNQDVDVAPDIYSFSVAGYTGRFTIQADTATLLPDQPLRVERMANGTFQITAETGIRYQFAALETTKPNPNNFGRLGTHVSAWHLTQMISASSTDTIRLHYTRAAYQEPRHCVLTTGQLFPAWEEAIFNQLCGCTDPYTWHNVTPIPPVIQVQYLDSISARGARVVLAREPATHVLQQVRLLALSSAERRNVKTFALTHSFFPGVINDSNRRLRLDAVQERNGPSHVPAYQFYYVEGDMPPVSSLALDYWGYFNGATELTSNEAIVTADIVPALLWDPRINTLGFSPPRTMAAKRAPNAEYAGRGALQKIVYPTGGSTSFEYEGADFRRDSPLYLEQSRSFFLSCQYSPTSMDWTTCRDTFSLYSTAAVHLRLFREPSTEAGSGNNHLTNHYRDFNLILRRANKPDSIITKGKDYNYQIFDNGGERNYDYTLPRGHYILEIYCERYERDTYVYVGITAPPILKRNAPGPGIRVSKTTTIAANAPPLIRAYDYTVTDAIGSFSSGKPTLPVDPQGTPRIEDFLFKINRWQGRTTTLCSFINTSSDNAKLGDENNRYPFFYQHVTERQLGQGLAAGITVSDFEQVPLLFNDVVLTKRQVFRQPAGQPLQLAQREVTSFYTGPEKVYHAMRARQIVYTPPPVTSSPDMYTADPYTIAVAFIAPQQTLQAQYNEQGDSTVTITTAGYRNCRLARMATQTSTGWQISRYKYLDDYAAFLPAVSLLNHNSYFNPLIETQTWRTNSEVKDSLLIGGRLTFYAPLWRTPVSSWSLQLDQPQTVPDSEALSNGKFVDFFSDSHYQQDASVAYNSATGLLEQQQIPHGPPTAYVWGYNQTYPVAQVENATASAVEAVLGPAAIARLQGSTPGTDAEVRQLLATLRTQLPHARVTTYTYLPLVGITSITDPAGHTSFFEYDDLGRLLRTRDEQNRLLTQQEYHYARP